MHTTGELADDELDGVAGGAIMEPYSPKIWCPKCDSDNFTTVRAPLAKTAVYHTCKDCRYEWYAIPNPYFNLYPDLFP